MVKNNEFLLPERLLKSTYITFDDCLSAVDTETEETILNNLQEIAKNKTTIIVSHRVSSAKMLIKLLSLRMDKLYNKVLII
jgi:ABC-type multidrug transport system fused ATPase/permease subunit